MQNIEFSVTCPYCGQAFRVASQPGAKVQCQCPNCHQQMVFDAPQANAYQPQQPQQYAQPAQQQYNQPMQQQYGQPALQPQNAQPAPQPYSTQPGMQQMMNAQPSPYYQQAQNSPNSDYIEEDEDDDKPSCLMNGLCFLVPIGGLILYFIKKDSQPKSANSYLKWAVIGFVINFIIITISELLE